VVVIALILSPLVHAAGPEGCTGWSADEALEAAWRALRVVDCARCHGKHHDGFAAPSIVEYVRTQSRERFERIVLDGDPPRGMPGYRSNPLVARTVDALYRYFAGRAAGDIDRGKPCAAPRAPPPASGTIFPASGDAGESGDRRAEEGLAVR
jgi:mono/diheme cytochrome c family protein